MTQASVAPVHAGWSMGCLWHPRSGAWARKQRVAASGRREWPHYRA